VRYERLVLQAGDNAVTLRFHPRLTVVAGLAPHERDVLAVELLGGLTGGRPGVHLDLIDDVGRRVGIVRPADGSPDRIVERDTGEDITAQFEALVRAGTQPRRLDVLGVMGLSVEDARRLCRITAAELAAESRPDAMITTLAASDPARLWAAAARLVEAEETLERETRAADTSVEDAPLVEEVERRHVAFDVAQRRTRGTRHDAIFIAATCAPAAGVALALHNTGAALGFVAVAAVTACLSVVFRRRAEAARRAELEALSGLGATSYYGFELQRVDGLLGRRDTLGRVVVASEEHRRALDAWQTLAGDIDASWALARRDAITAMGDRVRSGAVSPLSPHPDVDPLKLAEWLVDRFAAARRVGTTRESVPLILDDPFVGLDAGLKVWALGLITRFAGSPQVVYLTADRDVVAWGRIEAIGGELSVLDPAPDRTGTAGATKALSTV